MEPNAWSGDDFSLATMSTKTHILRSLLPTTMVNYSDADKGEQIRITGGTYRGRNGWRWKGKADTLKRTYVIIELEDGVLKGTRLSKTNVGAPWQPPTNYVEAALQQHLQIDETLDKLCMLLAKCNLTGEERDLHRAFFDRMQAARVQKLSEGQSASWFHVEFADEEM